MNHRVFEAMGGSAVGGITRRQLLWHAALAAGGLAGVIQRGTAPAIAATKRELLILSWNHFVPASDEKLKEQIAAFSKQTGASVQLNTIAHRELPAKWAAEVQSQSGHDLIVLIDNAPQLYKDQLADVSDVCQELGSRYGGWWDFCREVSIADGQWKSVPWYYIGTPATYREDYFQQVNEPPAETYDDLLRAGRKLRAIGHPIGFAISQTGDSNWTLFPLLWSFGASTVAEDGKTVTINSPQTAQALEYVTTLYHDCMEAEVLSWDDASNNRFMLSGKGAWTLNAISIYESAKKSTPALVKVLNHSLMPAGPVRRIAAVPYWSLGVWRFTKNVELAKEFLRYHFQREPQQEFIAASGGYNQPLLKEFDQHPIWTSDPKLLPLVGFAKWAHLIGWPGPPTREAQLVSQLYIIPNMFAKAVTGMKPKDAMVWAEEELRKVYG
ncbi:MAG TPA: extracellular solute-binding protein [Alphaproteobacteria bacterium]|nr:extracellular solute-binding protein [Alphaproteobacteria bacterium]